VWGAPEDKADATEPDTVPDAAPNQAEDPIVVGEAAEPTYDHAEDQEPLMDPSYEELWDGTDAIKLDLPEIPALDLDWGEADDDPS
jgi:hypothetical protein